MEHSYLQLKRKYLFIKSQSGQDIAKYMFKIFKAKHSETGKHLCLKLLLKWTVKPK